MGEEPGLRGMQGEQGNGKEDAEVQKTRHNGRQEHKASRVCDGGMHTGRM